MSALHNALESYLSLRRGLGSEIEKPGAYLHRFVEFLDREKATFITVDLALRWARAPAKTTTVQWARRLGHARRFALWLSATDPRTEVPSLELLPDRYRRRPPYIYSDEEIERIVREAARLRSRSRSRPRSRMRGATYATLFGLLAVTGLRMSEALALDRDDVDLSNGVLAIRRAKFGKSRFVPIDDSTCRALQRYARKRDLCFPSPSCPAFLVSNRDRRVTRGSALYNFAIICRAVGVRRPGPRHRVGRGPRPHDLRHRFVVKTLVRWYREGRDVDRELPKLSTYIGHTHVADTYWYIEAVPELLRLATQRAVRRAKRAS
jgi:integrase